MPYTEHGVYVDSNGFDEHGRFVPVPSGSTTFTEHGIFVDGFTAAPTFTWSQKVQQPLRRRDRFRDAKLASANPVGPVVGVYPLFGLEKKEEHRQESKLGKIRFA